MLAFHASAPAGQWINDPNALVHAQGAFHLFAQHRADGPAFRETGWARFSSPDLLLWTFDGSVLPPVGAEWAYSGCVEQTPVGLAALHTAHVARSERQVRRTSHDGGLSWSAAEERPDLGHPAPNRRDPYIFRDGAGWGLLLAEPCDWTDWASQPPSRLQLYRSRDGSVWSHAGTIGPWRPQGIMWEVPVFARIDGHDVLFVSEVDRREGGADCSVRAWVGSLLNDGFQLDPILPPDGQLVDNGPDFYALMPSTEGEWPLEERAFVAWLSNWQTARAMRWPGFYGGPISLPRVLSVETSANGPRLLNRPLTMVRKRFARQVDSTPVSGRGRLVTDGDWLTLRLSAGRDEVRFDVDWINGAMAVTRTGELPWRGTTDFSPADCGLRQVEIYVDGPVIEFFVLDEGIAASVALGSTDAPLEVSMQVDGIEVAPEWERLE